MLVPDVGRPISLGAKQDHEDAEALLSVIQAIAPVRTRYKARVGRLAREAVWQLWEGARLPKPLVGPRYPARYPWSPEARERYEVAGGKRPPGGWGLIIEHVVPKGLLLDVLYTQAPSLDVASLMRLLRTGLAAAVITTAEDRQLGSKLATKMPEGHDAEDLWARYNAAGFDVTTFEPLEKN